MSNSSVEKALGIYARMLGKQFGVIIQFVKGLGTACTDGKTIQIDAEFQGIGGKLTINALFGLVTHEVMHIRLTNFEFLNNALEAARAAGKNVVFLKHLHNVIEDMWGERVFRGIYPRTWSDTLESMVGMRKQDLYGPPNAQSAAQPPQIFMNWFLSEHLARHYQIKNFMNDAKLWREVAIDKLGQELVDQIKALIPLVDGVEGSSPAFDLALRVYDCVAELAKQDKAQQQQSQPGSSGQGNAQPSADEPSAAQQVMDSTEEDLANCKTEKGEAAAESAKQVKDQVRGFGGGMNKPVSSYLNKDVSDSFNLTRLNVRQKLTGRLENLLSANTWVHREMGRSGGRLHAPSLAQIRLGRLDVFVREELGEAIDTVVDVVVDSSGSMSKIWDQTLGSAYAVADVLATYQVPLGMSAFSTNRCRITRPEMPWRTISQESIALINESTDTAMALNESAYCLLDQTQARKIMLVLTDGEPDDFRSAVTIARQVVLVGIDLAFVFIGIQGQSFEAALKQGGLTNIARCEDPSDCVGLARAMESALAQAMGQYLSATM